MLGSRTVLWTTEALFFAAYRAWRFGGASQTHFIEKLLSKMNEMLALGWAHGARASHPRILHAKDVGRVELATLSHRGMYL